MKLKKIGFNKLGLSWFNSYLTKWIQITKIRDAESIPLEIVCGVPQGSVLRTNLFLINVNDMSKRLKYLTPYLYADEKSLYWIKRLKRNNSKNKPGFSIVQWSNKLIINMTKTNYSLLETP